MTEAWAEGGTAGVFPLGRPPTTTRAQLEHIGLRLFTENGFENTTVERIAAEAGISRRTFFRYFASKNELPWGEFDSRLGWLGQRLRAVGLDESIADSVASAVIEFNTVPEEETPWHRRRMELLLHVPALQAYGTLRYRDWREVIAGFVAERRHERPEDLLPRTAGYLALGASLAAYEQWLTDDTLELPALMRSSFALVRGGMAEAIGERIGPTSLRPKDR